MKVPFAIKALFKNYRVSLVLLILGYVYQFSQLKWRTLPQAIQSIIDTWNLNGTASERLSQLPPLVYQMAAALILWVCVYSGLIYLCRLILHEEPANMGDFAAGVEKNLKNVLIVLTLFTISFGLAAVILQNLIAKLPIEGSAIEAAKSVLFSALTLFYNALAVYGAIFLMENGVKLRRLFHSTVRFIFSFEGLKLFALMLTAGILLQPVYMLKAHFYSNLLSSGSLGSFLDIVSPARIPVWIKGLELLFDTMIKAFTIMYVSSLFFSRPNMIDTTDTADTNDATDTTDKTDATVTSNTAP